MSQLKLITGIPQYYALFWDQTPPFEIVKAYVKRIWAHFEIDQIIQVRKGLYLVRFVHLQDKLTVERRGFFFFGNKPFVIKGWNADLDLDIDNMTFLP